ncbi:beta-lactamase family protein [Erythrobacter sp. LQ02-29]|uniref:serine hydrolase domain-containing protein n=1 Tax=Erythrobacter sp. LQ02-29 TaxID=2920384 RepID=UPI001F4E17F7|nr:serine hydrolase domain-containing protein [Erythrobacter sp. LQ02-29]MCP9222632.1 beta-lactamase family protein [Erythrobacter sp. LQ02-29]
MRFFKLFIGLALIGTLIAAGAISTAQTLDETAAMQGPLTPEPAVAQASPSSGGTGETLTQDDINAWLDGYMPYALRSGDVAGAVVTVVRDGQIVAAKGYGYADVGKGTPVDPARTLFRPGSVSKLVTWTAVMQQVQAGKIDLDADVNRYLDFEIPPRDGQPVTMRQLMTHTAGFEEAVKDLISFDPKAAQPIGTYLKRWVPERIFAAGTTPAYSNWGTTLAGYIVQRTSGIPFDDYVEQRIFRPLGMNTATFRQPLPARLEPLMATGYPLASGEKEGFEIVVPAPAGSLSASGLDMAKFMIAHLQGGGPILDAKTAAMMHDSPLDKVDPASLIPPLNRMELGFFETNINGRDVIAHLGDTQNFHTSLHLFMDEGVGLYVSFNSTGKEGVVQEVRGQLFQDFADRYFPASGTDGRVDPETAKRHARMMTGVWMNSRRGQSNFIDILNLFGQTDVTLDADGGLLVPSLVEPGGAPRKWDEIAPFVWRDRTGHDRLAAKVVDGKVVRWSFDMVSPFMVFDPVERYRSKTWILPLLYASLAILLLTALYWPATWFVRRRYQSELRVAGNARRAYRAAGIMAWAELLTIGGWTALVLAMFTQLELLSGASDPLLWLAKIVAIIVFVGAVPIAGWNAWLTWTDGRKWTSKLWSVLFLLATVVVLYVAIVFHVLVLSTNY